MYNVHKFSIHLSMFVIEDLFNSNKIRTSLWPSIFGRSDFTEIPYCLHIQEMILPVVRSKGVGLRAKGGMVMKSIHWVKVNSEVV